MPDNKIRLVKEFLKELGAAIKIKRISDMLNAQTIATMNELKASKGELFKNTEELLTVFDSYVHHCNFYQVLRDLKLQYLKVT